MRKQGVPDFRFRRFTIAGVLVTLVALVAMPQTAYAHGFGNRYDLPVPRWLYLTGAGAAVALSFAIISVFMRGTPGLHGYPRLDLFRWRLGRALGHPALLLMVKVASVALFLLLVVAGLA